MKRLLSLVIVIVLVAVLTVVVSACASNGRGADQGFRSEGSLPVAATPEPGELSALDLFAGSSLGKPYPTELPPPIIDTTKLLRGQVPDGIPAIDDPQFVSVAEADAYLTENEGVVVLEIDGDARAYPAQILMWHEIVNDVVGGTPVAITYCPLCNSAVSYQRVVQGKVTTFGTSGLLFNSALVMYDRLTESLWTHYNGEAVVGLATSERLTPISSPLLSWIEFKEAFPNGLVLDRDNTGYARSYGENPYVNYDDPSSFPFLFRGEVDDKIGAQRRVTGVSIDGDAKAWTLEAISGGPARATHDRVGDQPVVLFWKAGQATALESGRIDGGRDVGSVGVFVPEANGERLVFTGGETGFVDDRTGSTWNILGEATSGPLKGSQLAKIPHLDTFWFAWFSYNPQTALVEADFGDKTP